MVFPCHSTTDYTLSRSKVILNILTNTCGIGNKSKGMAITVSYCDVIVALRP